MKINCVNPDHSDTTPSLHVYEERCFCFVCGFMCKTEEVLNADEIKNLRNSQSEKENIEESIKSIKDLPKTKIRGLDLPTGHSGYYVVWPDDSYYKLRRYDDNPRYVGPRGVRPPLFKLGRNNKTLVLVEGELNALSLYQSVGSDLLHVVSPGAAGNFMDERTINYCLQFDQIYVIVDKDPAGIANGKPLRDLLRDKNKTCSLIALDKDFNQILQESGSKVVEYTFILELGLT